MPIRPAAASATEPLIGVLNAGSSSLKYSFYEGERRLLSGQVEGLGAHPSVSAAGPDGEAITPPDLGDRPLRPSEVLPVILLWARQGLGAQGLAALGHRVVHGGMDHAQPTRVTPELLAEYPLRRPRSRRGAAPDSAKGDVGGSAGGSSLPPIRGARALRYFLRSPRAPG